MDIKKFKNWRKKRSRKERIIEDGNCSVKHAFDKKEIMKAALRMDLTKKLQCLRCKKWVSIAEMLDFVAKKEGIDLKNKQSLFDSYVKLANKDDKS